MTVRKHIVRELENLLDAGGSTFLTSDIQTLSFDGKNEFGKFLGSTETYTREFRRMREEGILRVKKLPRKNKQQVWQLIHIFPSLKEMNLMYKSYKETRRLKDQIQAL